MNAIFERVSIRKFEQKTVEPEKIERILRAAMAAPSAGNQQPWEFCVVTDPVKIKELSECSPYSGCAAGAPIVIVPCYRTEGLHFPEMAMIDLAIATQNILLEIAALGLGGVWLGVAPVPDRIEKVDAALGIGKSLHTFALVPLGYPAEMHTQQDRYDENRIRWYK